MSLPLTDLLREPNRFLFFTGKGGVGKTSLACATAVALADTGKRVLLVSTDPVSNLDEVLGHRLANTPTAISSVPHLFALNINPAEAARAYRDRVVGPYRGVLPEAALRSMEEQLSGACTLEIAAFDEFTKLLGDPAATADFEHVVFDTAPTGHTLRLLQLPAAWTGFIETNTTGTSCLGPLAGLQAQRRMYEASIAALADAKRTILLLVSRPQLAALREADRTRGELAALGMNNQRLIVNSVFHTQEPTDPVAGALEARGRRALSQMPASLAAHHRGAVAGQQPRGRGGIAGVVPRQRHRLSASAVGPERGVAAPRFPFDPRGRPCQSAAWGRDDHGQRGCGQDHDCRRHCDRTGPARFLGSPEHHRPGSSRCRRGP